MDARIVGAGVALYGVQTKKEWTKDVAGPFLFEEDAIILFFSLNSFCNFSIVCV